jgi:hypothetical protein
MYPRPQENLELSSQQRASNELIKRIRKLRWIGKEDEAREVQRSLGRIPSRGVLAAPCETD